MSEISMKLSSASPPAYSSQEGTFSVDYRNHNGRVLLGSGDWLFETHWSRASNGLIHVMNDPPSIRGVAVAPSVRKIGSVTEAIFARANFTSRSRTPQVGQVVLFENINGYAAALELKAVSLSPDGEPGTKLDAYYKIRTDRMRDFSEGTPDLLSALHAAATDALTSLARVDLDTDMAALSSWAGHNGPPTEAALTKAEHDMATSTLQKLADEAAKKDVQESTLRKGGEWLSETISITLKWISKRVKLIEEGFFRQIGAAAAFGMISLSVWAALTSKLQVVLSIIDQLGDFFPGIH